MRRHRVRELDRAHDRLDRKLGLYTSLTIARTAWARQLPRRERRHPRRGALLEPRLLERDRANVDSSGIEGEYSAITVGTDGRGVISYYDGSGLSQDLKVAHCGNVACTTASYLAVDTAGQVVEHLDHGGVGRSAVRQLRDVTGDSVKGLHCPNVFCVAHLRRR